MLHQCVVKVSEDKFSKEGLKMVPDMHETPQNNPKTITSKCITVVTVHDHLLRVIAGEFAETNVSDDIKQT